MLNNNDFNSFYKYLVSKGYYFDKELVENFLLSLKVKPFIILTGNSGTGKTKLSQLYVNFLNNEYYHKIKVTTRARSWGYSKKDDSEGHSCGWALLYEYSKDILPLDNLQGSCKVEIGGHVSTADIKLTTILNYDKNNEMLKEYFKELYYKEEEIIQRDKELGKKRQKQLVDLYVDRKGIMSVFSKDYIDAEEFAITMNNIDSFLTGSVTLSVDIFDFVPINLKANCNIIANDIPASANFLFKYRLFNYLTPEIEKYLTEIKNNGETEFKLKICGFERDIGNFQPKGDIIEVLNSGSDNKVPHVIIPVGANWTDNTNIVGYYNVITEDYQHTPAYDLIMQAQDDLDNGYFLILDEMNLSHVERYFADFLSAIESGEEIPLYGENKTLKLPNNLFIIGTVNVDETTYMFSPKVLDRANTIEFNTLPAFDYMVSNMNSDDFKGNIDYLQSPLSDLNISNSNISDLEKILSTISYNDDNLWVMLARELTNFQEALQGSGFDFGFRVINEILRFMVVAWKYENMPNEWGNWERYFDAQIKQKILPKLHGSEKAIGSVLTKLFNLCLVDRNNNENPKNFEVTKEKCRYYNSALKLQNMSKVLSDQRYVSFIN